MLALITPFILKIALVYKDETRVYTKGLTNPVCPSYALVVTIKPKLKYKFTFGMSQIDTKIGTSKVLLKSDL